MSRATNILARRQPKPRDERPPLQLEPTTTYELLTRRMVEEIGAEVAHIRGRIDNLFWVVIGSLLLDMLLRLAG